MMNLWLLLPAVAALSLLLTAGLRRYAIARQLDRCTQCSKFSPGADA